MPHERGTSNTNDRGNSEDRRRRREWLVRTFGNGRSCPCSACGRRLTVRTVTADRIVPGCDGGRYVRGNIQPMCAFCNSSLGSTMRHERRRAA